MAHTGDSTITRSIFSDAATEKEFHLNGYVVRPLLNADEIQALSDFFHSCLHDVPTDQFFSTRCSDAIRERIHNGILPYVQAHLNKLVPGHTVRLNSFIAKKPNGLNGQVALHRDPTFVDPSKDTAVHVWCPLVDVDENNGCMKVVAGSHTLTDHICGAPFNPAPWDAIRGVLEAEFMTCVPMRAGEALIYDGRLLHGSDTNKTDRLRLATSTILIPREAKVRVYVWEKAVANKLAIVELADDFFARSADLSKPISPPYSEYVRSIGSVEHSMTPLQLAQIERLRPAR